MIAFVLSGGGARGALQIGALRALLEANIQPSLLVGTSVGAVNAAYVALRGFDLDSLEGLSQAWEDAASAHLLPANGLRMMLSALLRHGGGDSYQRMRGFFIAHGLTPDLRFIDQRGARLLIVATDLNAGLPVLYGRDPQQSVLEGVLASTAVPPWVLPIQKDGQWLMDGGAVSNLPIEAALKEGARKIIALDLADHRCLPSGGGSLLEFVLKLAGTVQQRQSEMELALAAAHGVEVHRIALQAEAPIPIWDFRHTEKLIARGYRVTCDEIAHWRGGYQGRGHKWWSRLERSGFLPRLREIASRRQKPANSTSASTRQLIPFSTSRVRNRAEFEPRYGSDVTSSRPC